MSLIPHNVSVRFSALMGGFTGPLTAAGRSVQTFGRGVGSSINIVNRLGSQMESISGRIQTLQRRMADAPRGMSEAQRRAMRDELRGLQDQHAALGRQRQSLQRVGQAATIAGVAMVAGFGYAVKAAADFDKSMSKVAAVSNATGKDLGALRKAAIDAGRDTQFSATQAADAEGELAKAGISVKDILGGALRGSLALAAAGEISLADSAVVAAQAMNIFNLKGKDVTHVADVLAAGANKSAADVKGLAWSLKMGGQVAAQTGLSLESTVGVLSLFADNALIGSDAGTSLKTMLQRLANPTDKMSATMDDLGLHLYDVNGNFIDMAEFSRQLQVGLGGLTQEQRNQAIASLGGADAARAINVLYKTGEQGVKQYTAAVNDNGAAQRTAAKLTDNLAGDLERLKGSLETALITSGSSANGVLRQMIQSLDFVAHGFLSLPSSVQSGTVVIIGITGAVILLAKGMIFLFNTTRDARVALIALGLTGPRVAAAMAAVRTALASTATFMTGPWGVAIAASVAILGIFLMTKKGATKATEDFTSAIKADSGALAENTRTAAANKLQQEGLTEIARKAGIELPRLTDAVLGDDAARRQIIATIDAQIAALMRAKPHTDHEALQSLQQVSNLGKLKDGINQVSGEIDASSQAYQDQAAAAANSTTETNNMTAAQVAAAAKTNENVSAEQKLVDTMTSATTKAGELKQAFADLTGGFISNTEAAIAQRAAVKSAAAESDHRAGLSDKETTSLIAIAKANQDVLSTMKDAGAEGDRVVEKQHAMTEAFIKTAMGLGATRKAATDLARNMGLFMKVADATTTSISRWVTGASNAAAAARHLAIRTGGDAATAQNAFRASVERSLPVLYAMAGSNGRLRGQVDALARSAGAVSGKMDISRRSFLAAASSMGVGAREAGRLWAKLQALKSKNISVNVNARGEWEVGGAPASRRSSFATGGRVPMVSGGSRNHDSVDAKLRVDEHVLTPEEVDAMGGHAAVYRLRKAALRGEVQGFANGGRVGTANLGTPGAASRVMAPVQSGYSSMLTRMTEIMAAAIKKALSGGSIIAAARSQIGLPYSWGGGGTGGPSYGIGRGAGTYGFDCSGLTEYAWWKGRHIDIGGTTDPQAAGSHAIPGPRPGALGFIGNPIHHVMLGSDRPGYVIQAPHTGAYVEEVQRSSGNWRWPNAAGKAKGGAVTRAEMIAGQKFITNRGANEAPLYGIAGDPGMVKGYAEGGWVLGVPGRDQVFLRGTAGEFMVKKRVAKRNRGLLEGLNAGQIVPGKLGKDSGTYVPNGLGGTSGKYNPDGLGKASGAAPNTPRNLAPGSTKDYSKPSKPVPTPDLGAKLEDASAPLHKKKKSTSSSGSGSGTFGTDTVDLEAFTAALVKSTNQLHTFSGSVGNAHLWVDAFRTSIANATRRVDAFSGGGGGSGNTVYQFILENNGVIGSRTEVDKWLATSLERLRRSGKIPR